MKLLIGAACATIILVGSIWLLDRQSQKREIAAMKSAIEDREDRKRIARCKEKVAAADQGKSGQRGVDFCRAILEIDAIEKAER